MEYPNISSMKNQANYNLSEVKKKKKDRNSYFVPTFTNTDRIHLHEDGLVVIDVHNADPHGGRTGQLGWPSVLGDDGQHVGIFDLVVQALGSGHYTGHVVNGKGVVGVAAGDLVVDSPIGAFVSISCRYLWRIENSLKVKKCVNWQSNGTGSNV